MSHDTTSHVKFNWDELWINFAWLIKQPVQKHKELILSMCLNNSAMGEELERLLKAHTSQSHVLDMQPQWQVDFNQVFEPPKKIHGYTIEQKLGSGGIGEVYLASKSDEGFERKVAIKFATAGRFATHVLTSFNTELEVLLSLNHANIERLYDGGITADKVPFLVVEYIDGTHIDHYCDNEKLTIKQRLQLFQKICQALDVVHRSLIVHRDIKAGNIMVSKDGEPKLLDFGLAKLADKQQANKHATYSSQMMTVAYASPEQINGSTITTASDIYSLGVLLYYLLAGKLPYTVSANDMLATIRTINDDIPLLASKNIQLDSTINREQSKLEKQLSGDLEQIIAKALAKEPERRYLSALQFSEDIQNYLENRPIRAKKDTVLYRMGKFVRRHVIGVSLSSFAVIALIVLSTVLYKQSNNLQQSLKNVQQEQKKVTQVTDFLKGMFKVSDPLVTDAKIIKVKDLLDYSTEQLDGQFPNEPITKATLYETLGNVYLNLSLLTKAESLYKKATKLYVEYNKDEGIIRMYLARVRLLQQQGKLTLAQAEMDKLLSVYAFHSLKTPTQAEIETYKGINHYQLGHFKQAKQALELALKKRISLFGKDSQLVNDIYPLLGNVYWRLGDFDRVSYYYHKAYQVNKRILGETHHKTIKSRSSLGVLAYSQGDYEAALQHFNFVASVRMKRLGDNHILTASAYNRLGATYYEVGRYELAEKALSTAIRLFTHLNMDKSMKYARTLNNLGLIQRQKQYYEKALKTFLKVKKIETELLGENHTDVAGINNNLGMVVADLGNFTQALSLFQQAYDVQFKVNGEKNANIAFSMTNIGRMYMQLDQLESAEEWIKRAFELRLDKLGKDSLYTLESQLALIELKIKDGSYHDLNKDLQNIVTVRERELPKDDWRIAEIKNIYASINYQQDKGKFGQSYICSLKAIQNKLGNHHYRTKEAQLRGERFAIIAKDNSIGNCVQ
jgi:serine/threonine-protein kinase